MGEYTYRYPRPSLTADNVLFDLEMKRVLLVLRGGEPFKGCWALPGGFFDFADTDIEHTAARELEEETTLTGIPLQLVGVFSKEGRDPRGRTITVAFTAKVDPLKVHPKGGDDAAEARWHDLDKLPPLAFDHHEIIARAKEVLDN